MQRDKAGNGSMTTLHRFAIEELSLEVSFNDQSSMVAITEFMIDGRALIEWLGLKRDLGNCESDLDASMQKHAPKITAHALLALQARASAVNSLGSNRVVLYRCHCGCDECGVISAQVLETDNTIEWRDVATETASGVETGSDGAHIARLQFDKHAYLSELQIFSSPCIQRY